MIRLLAMWLLIASCTSATIGPSNNEQPGKTLAFGREKGNCLACHEIENGEFPGNIGPPLKNLSTRYKTKEDLKAQIWDASRFNPETSMPPFGKNKILSDREINQVVDYLWELK